MSAVADAILHTPYSSSDSSGVVTLVLPCAPLGSIFIIDIIKMEGRALAVGLLPSLLLPVLPACCWSPG
jgi:hypothetical protein